MALFIEITEGLGKGNRYPIAQGARLGRSSVEILFKDPKVSSLHAQIEGSDSGEFFLVDRGSANGIKVRGQKFPRIALLPGVIFTIGNTTCKVVEDAQEEVTENREVSGVSESWLENLKKGLLGIKGQNQVDAVGVRVIKPALQLKFTQGIQLNKTYVVGYGPRKAGGKVIDLELLDPNAPDLAFEIVPLSDRLMIEIRDPQVLFNGRAVSSDSIRSGDVIEFGDSRIELTFLED